MNKRNFIGWLFSKVNKAINIPTVFPRIIGPILVRTSIPLKYDFTSPYLVQIYTLSLESLIQLI